MLQDISSRSDAVVEACRDARSTVKRLAQRTRQWHEVEPALVADDLLEGLHAANFRLWHLEDLARDPLADDARIASVKRGIDAENQCRNDTIEQIDETLLKTLPATPTVGATVPLHSETPGQMLDRLSILSLKVFHTAEEVQRADVDPVHRAKNTDRHRILLEQQDDLAGCLSQLWGELEAGTRRFQQYRQFKMYNDPELNPVVYRAGKAAPRR